MYKSSKKVLIAAIAAIGLGAGAAQAVPISGAFSIAGAVTAPLPGPTMNAATGIDFAGPISANGCVGDIATIVGGGANCGGATGTILDIAVGSLNGSGTVNLAVNIPNWITLTIGGVTFSLTQVSTIDRSVTGDQLALTGLGVMDAGGAFDPTPGTFSFTAQGIGSPPTFSFSSSQASVGIIIPEPAMLSLIGFALAGLALGRRRRQA